MAAGARSHHLLRHPTPSASAHEFYGTSDLKEIVKKISSMGQRELQGMFRRVYSTETFSNNNAWLRRKLLEAVGLPVTKAALSARAGSADKLKAAPARRPISGKKTADPESQISTSRSIRERRATRKLVDYVTEAPLPEDSLKRTSSGSCSEGSHSAAPKPLKTEGCGPELAGVKQVKMAAFSPHAVEPVQGVLSAEQLRYGQWVWAEVDGAGGFLKGRLTDPNTLPGLIHPPPENPPRLLIHFPRQASAEKHDLGGQYAWVRRADIFPVTTFGHAPITPFAVAARAYVPPSPFASAPGQHALPGEISGSAPSFGSAAWGGFPTPQSQDYAGMQRAATCTPAWDSGLAAGGQQPGAPDGHLPLVRFASAPGDPLRLMLSGLPSAASSGFAFQPGMPETPHSVPFGMPQQWGAASDKNLGNSSCDTSTPHRLASMDHHNAAAVMPSMPSYELDSLQSCRAKLEPHTPLAAPGPNGPHTPFHFGAPGCAGKPAQVDDDVDVPMPLMDSEPLLEYDDAPLEIQQGYGSAVGGDQSVPGMLPDAGEAEFFTLLQSIKACC